MYIGCVSLKPMRVTKVLAITITLTRAMNFFVVTLTILMSYPRGKIAQKHKTVKEHKAEKWKSTNQTAVMSFIFPFDFCICFHIKERELDRILLSCPTWNHSIGNVHKLPLSLFFYFVIYSPTVKPWMEEQHCNQSSPTITCFLLYCYYFLSPLNHSQTRL